MDLQAIPRDLPVLIAGPTASGKSALAMKIAERHGGIIVNADASQVYSCWRSVTARPTHEDEARAPHVLYGHVNWDAPYSAGHWLRDVRPFLLGSIRPIIVGGTGLYFMALTEGMADIPETPKSLREKADQLDLPTLLAGLDDETSIQIDTANRARVQRAWEVLHHTGRGLADWQRDTPAPLLDASACTRLVFDVEKDWLEKRIFQRFDKMIAEGALDEVAAMADKYDPAKPAFRAIGVPELTAYIKGEASLEEARYSASVATRQYAKRQRTWFRKRMRDWVKVDPTKT